MKKSNVFTIVGLIAAVVTGVAQFFACNETAREQTENYLKESH